MRPLKISTNFVPLKDTDFGIVAERILSSMEGNPNFTTPVPSLDSLAGILEAYKKKLLEAIDGDRIKAAYKRASRKKLEEQLRVLALYVMHIASGDLKILTSSGFNLTKTPEKVYITNPGTIKLQNGISSGQLVSIAKAVKGARNYIHEICKDGEQTNDQWQAHNSSMRKYTFTNLTPGQKYWVRVSALGSGQQKAISEPTYQWVQ